MRDLGREESLREREAKQLRGGGVEKDFPLQGALECGGRGWGPQRGSSLWEKRGPRHWGEER